LHHNYNKRKLGLGEAREYRISSEKVREVEKRSKRRI